ncbi:MAG: UDP-3-O-(3-hydroxymyristoyl)glucosamine N-acyltransferase [Candidatus Cloacimonetes bacterium]|nr:UDP-3-O-(3-hydroxymyristoyl)glucosamine N-acyltransferase [Candidatus Cloacimonadota bacterium]MBL7085770.1 UDP-3-O-(3-hydroxymyristoyl)glucosamine N-acyltransferase [Candidatus Cloacimonadota bacterium]
MKKFKHSISLKDVEKISQGKLISVNDSLFNSVATLEDADSSSIAFYQDVKYIKAFKESKAGLIIIPKDETLSKIPERNYILCEKPFMSFLRIVSFLLEKEDKLIKGKYIHQSANIHSSVKLPNYIKILPNVVVEEGVILEEKVVIEANSVIKKNSIIGEESHIFPNVVIYPDTIIGKKVRIHSGCIVGCDGFGYIWDGTQHRKIPQIGNVIIEDDVEIGANVTIDRATLGNTIIKKGSKIDNLVQIAHNVKIGRNVIICSQVGIAGSSEIGDNSVLAGQVGITDHIKIGKKVMIAAQSGVAKDVPDGKILFGYPAIDAHKQRRIIAAMKELPEMRRFYHKLMKKDKNDSK